MLPSRLCEIDVGPDLKICVPADSLIVPFDTIKILLATDNHIGYMERDPIRGQDSINTFREVLELAVQHDVDFILLAGDLFHENKPSRDCLYQTTALLREYTMGDKPVQVELLSDPNDGQAAGFSFPAVNYEDPNLNVGIPVFSIHGNHDDPQGTGTEGALCALDVLSVSGLLNYMGKFDLPYKKEATHTPGIDVRPVLLRKGNTKLGMYGIGNVKDARMHVELRSNRVRMFMPKDKKDWFNILLVHQNRVKHGPQEYVPEGLFDNDVDLVVWGHEHDCRIVPEKVAGRDYYITQPGSSVATSLADGEALPKHVALLQVQGKDFELTPIPLRTVRPFVIEEIVLSQVAEEEDFELSDQIAITKFLRSRVNALIEQANRYWEENNADRIAAAERDGTSPPERMLPLVRLKVDTTGVAEMSNPIRFGQEFQGRIANPRDMLVFHRAKKAAARSKVVVDAPELSIDDPDLTTSEKLEKVRVATLVKEYLAAQEMQLLGEGGMSDAIQLFVEKDDIHAIQGHVSRELKAIIQDVKKQKESLLDEEVEEILMQAKENHDKEYEAQAKAKQADKKGKGKSRQVSENEESDDSMKMDVDYEPVADDSDLPPPSKKSTARKAPAKKTAAKKAPARGRGKRTADVSNSEVEVIEVDDDEDEISQYEDEAPPKPVKRTNRAAVLRHATLVFRKTTARKATPAASSRQSQLNFAPAAGRSKRAAATKARKQMVVCTFCFELCTQD
ncbi:DNA repair exonuclease [Fistulina hepatica ATCC 64428]|uniref:Double-strand break repair protein n=1 Tax=Fistulina hepatica ATCC 64428 TaxID=1128425 RepID=A0A0D7AG94_9AGAR|nr:DNA repair exonuclease [Fistulina hepatica ATCC 64428]